MNKSHLCILVIFLGLATQGMAVWDTAAEGLPTDVVNFVTSRMQRLHHNLFHNVRFNWGLLSLDEQHDLAKIGWTPLRQAKAYYDNGTVINLDGESGEDFLYMHNQMIVEVNAAAAAGSSGWTVVGWTACPTPTDTNWPVPAAYAYPPNPSWADGIAYYKSDDFYNNEVVPEETWLTTDANLRTITLGQLGVRLEFGLHDLFHVRFSSESPVGYRIQSTHPTEYIDPKWDVTTYTYLGDFYSAHCSVYFWKIHGWIEIRMAQWLAANSLTQFQWISTWEGGPMGTKLKSTDVDTDVVTALSAIAEKHKNIKTTSDSPAGIILGCVLGGLAIIMIGVLGVVYMTKVLPQKRAAGAYKPAQAKTHNTEVGEGYPIAQRSP